jgi:hypothetical protein
LENIFQVLDDVVEQSNREPIELVFVYCGHGTQRRSRDADEEDGLDEGIVTMDGAFISDNELRAYLVDMLDSRSTCLSIFDCCHSATILDLPVTIEFDPRTNRFFNKRSGQTLRAPQKQSSGATALAVLGAVAMLVWMSRSNSAS